MFSLPRFVLTASIAAVTVPTFGADFIKLQNTIDLNMAGAWVNAAVPGVDDVLVWDATYTTPGAIGSLSPLGGDLSVLGLKVTNVGGNRNVNGIVVGYQDPGSANTLTIGSAGIDMSTATQALRTQSQIVIGADQTWNVPNVNTNTSPSGGFNNGEDVSFETQTLDAAFNLGGDTVSVVGNGQVTITSGFTISNGTLNVEIPFFVIQGGGNRQTTINSDVTINIASGGVTHFQSNSGPLESAATINLNGGTLNFSSNNASNGVTQSGNINVLAPSTIAVTKTNTNNGSTGPLNFTGNLVGAAALTINNSQPTAVTN
ncbi:MAG: hypothetical protein ABI680_21065, partial [Chthoniobacteraceae bacterium]